MKILKLRILAKVTHNRYGKKRYPANFLVLNNLIVKTKIKIHKIKIFRNAKNGVFSPKNKTDHKKLKNNCAIKSFIKDFCDQIKYKTMPINAYNAVQTGPKSQLGG
jgi:hypothetical protein